MDEKRSKKVARDARKIFSRWADKIMEVAGIALTGSIEEDLPYEPDLDNPMEKDFLISFLNVMRRAVEMVAMYHNGVREAQYVIRDMIMVMDEMSEHAEFAKLAANMVKNAHGFEVRGIGIPIGDIPKAIRKILGLDDNGDNKG